MPRRSAAKRAASSTCRACGKAVRWATEVTEDGRLVRRPLDTLPAIAGRRYRTVDERGTTYAAAVTTPGGRGYPDHRDRCGERTDEPVRVRRDVDG